VDLAYWQPNWRRDKAPLLDELAASVDHVTAHSRGGSHDLANFKTACARCNARKSAKDEAAFRQELQAWRVRGKYGEPTAWDGLAFVFLTLARQDRENLQASEIKWVTAIEEQLASFTSQF
jgi:hypothetical protein